MHLLTNLSDENEWHLSLEAQHLQELREYTWLVSSGRGEEGAEWEGVAPADFVFLTEGLHRGDDVESANWVSNVTAELPEVVCDCEKVRRFTVCDFEQSSQLKFSDFGRELFAEDCDDESAAKGAIVLSTEPAEEIVSGFTAEEFDVLLGLGAGLTGVFLTGFDCISVLD